MGSRPSFTSHIVIIKPAEPTEERSRRHFAHRLKTCVCHNPLHAAKVIVPRVLVGRLNRLDHPTAPFLLSIPVLALAATLVATTWKENVAAPAAEEDAKNDEAAAAAPKEGAIKAAWDVVRKDKRMLALGAMQARRHAATRPERVGAIARRRGARCFVVVCQRPLGVLTFHSCSERQCLNRSGSAAG